MTLSIYSYQLFWIEVTVAVSLLDGRCFSGAQMCGKCFGMRLAYNGGWQGGAGASDGERDRAATLGMASYGEEESWDYLGCALRANPIERAQ